MYGTLGALLSVQPRFLVLLICGNDLAASFIFNVSRLIPNISSCLQGVQSIFLLISLAEGEKEANSTEHGNDSHGTIIPLEQRIFGEGDECLAKRRGDRGGEKSNGLDGRFHVGGSFGVCVPRMSLRGSV